MSAQAQAQGKMRTDFILEAPRRAAQEALLGRALVEVSAPAYAKFVERLEAPPKPSEWLRKTMRTRPPWS
jgi:uncharacterized protein (DUF1778 family)